MGTKIESERYLSRMKDLNDDSNSCSWPPYCGRQYYLSMRDDKDAVKRTMVEHEAIFKNQVYELNRLYRVQRDMMQEFKVKELSRSRQTLFNLNCAEDVHSNFSSPSGVARKKAFDLHLPAEEHVFTDDDKHLFSVSSSRVSNGAITSFLDLNEPVEIDDPDDCHFICAGHSPTAPFSSSSNSNKLINGSTSSAINFSCNGLDHLNSRVSTQSPAKSSRSVALEKQTNHEVIDVDKVAANLPKKQLMFDINEPYDIEEEDCGKEKKRCVIDLNCVVAEDEEDDDIAAAADAIMALSSSLVDDGNNDVDPLLWLAEIICARRQDFDYFESMTLNLTETKLEDYTPKPVVPVTGSEVAVRTAYPSRKARRGRQRRDFQRDILPGIASLSRHEVTEDLQAFGGAWNAPAVGNRNGSRGRKKRLASTRSPTPSIYINASLEGWGKATRRPRRQRCHSAAIALV